jgi:hypothetical protein
MGSFTLRNHFTSQDNLKSMLERGSVMVTKQKRRMRTALTGKRLATKAFVWDEHTGYFVQYGWIGSLYDGGTYRLWLDRQFRGYPVYNDNETPLFTLHQLQKGMRWCIIVSQRREAWPGCPRF